MSVRRARRPRADMRSPRAAFGSRKPSRLCLLIGLAALTGCVGSVSKEKPGVFPPQVEATAGQSSSRSLRGNESRALELPEELDLSRKRLGDQGIFLISIQPSRDSLSLNKIHSWFVRVLDRDGAPVDDLQIEFDGGMPAHNHGFPTVPKVTKGIGNGTYLLEGVKFSMAGWWEFKLRVSDGERSDAATFNVVVGDG